MGAYGTARRYRSLYCRLDRVTIDIIIQLNYYKPAGLHYVSAVAEIDGREGEVPRLQELWRRDGPHERLRWTGRRSKLEERFQAVGVEWTPPMVVEGEQ